MVAARQRKISEITNNEHYTIYNGSMLDMLEVIEKNSIDSIVTDPPYELNFMGKGWDNTGIAFQKETWEKCLEVLKPGGYLLAFGGSRTFHRIAVAIEDAGFEIRDTIMWLYGSGFPKSMNISKALDKHLGAEREKIGKHQQPAKSIYTQTNIELSKDVNITAPSTKEVKQWQGWGSCLKPAYEPVIVARKPFKSSVAENVMKYGTGGINIDECRVGNEEFEITKSDYDEPTNNAFGHIKRTPKKYVGRFPANVIHDGSEEVISGFPDTNASARPNLVGKDYGASDNINIGGGLYSNGHLTDSGSASRYFYTAKASKKDRDEGLDIDYKVITDGRKKPIDNAFNRGKTLRKNIHPTVKPCELMQYLVRLVSPKGATILDPFMGSGSTGKAVMFENRERQADYKFIGVDLSEKYCNISSARIDYALNKYEYDFQKELAEAKERGQMSLF